MPPSPSRPSHPLALPSPISKSNPNRPSSPPKKKRKRPRASTSAGTGGDLTRALDEADDVSDTELVAPDNLGRRMDMAASDEEDEEGEGEGGGGGGGGRRGKNEEGVAGRAKKRRGETLYVPLP